MNCENCHINGRTESDIYSYLCEQCRAGDPCNYVLEVAYDNGSYTPFSFANGVDDLADAMNAFRTRKLLFRLLGHSAGAYQDAPTAAAA